MQGATLIDTTRTFHRRRFYPTSVPSRVRKAVEKTFKANNHNPSAAQWAALNDLIKCLDSIVHGTGENKVYLSSLDPGIGKTTVLIKYIDALLAQQHEPYRDCGVLIAMNTKEEIERFVSEAAIPRDLLAVWTDEARYNELGRPDHEHAQVLITTHKRMEMELDGQEFWSATRLHYKGDVRRLRVWDEAWLPGHPISLSVDDVLYIARQLSSVSRALRDEVVETFMQADKLPDGSTLLLPDYVEKHDVDLNRLMEAALGKAPANTTAARVSEEQANILTDLYLVSGRLVKVRKDGRSGSTAIDFHDTMPSDLAPIVVLDASGRKGVRVLYEDLEHSRGILKRLKSAPKSYRKLRLHVWQRGGGKEAWRENSEELIEGVVNTILEKPDEEWLIIHHKAERGVPDLAREIEARVAPEVFWKLHFRNWGRHTAVNTYSHVTNIILAGTLFLRPSQYEALKRLGTGVRPGDGEFSAYELKSFEIGEHANNILQALCRGAVRRSEGDTCPPCNAYIIASVRSGIPKALPAIFPDCQIRTWMPVIRTLEGEVKAAFKIVREWAKTAGPDDLLRFTAVANNLGMTRRAFKDRIRKNKAFQNAIASIGVVEWGPNVYFTAWRKAT